MAMQLIPSHWVVRRSTPFFTRENVPQALLTHHNTAAGVFGQLCVMEGSVTYHGFADEQAEEPELSLVIRAGEFATSPPGTGTGSSCRRTLASTSTSGPSRPSPINPCSTAAKDERRRGGNPVECPLYPCRSKQSTQMFVILPPLSE